MRRPVSLKSVSLTFGLTAAVAMNCRSMQAQDQSQSAASMDETVFVLHTTDETGAPLNGAQAYLISVDNLPLSKHWVSGANDQLTLNRADLVKRVADGKGPTGAAMLVVRAPQHAWAVQRLQFPLEQKNINVKLTQGQAIELVLRDEAGRTIPDDLLPIIYTPGQSVAAWLNDVQEASDPPDPRVMFSTVLPEAAGNGRFTVHVPADCPPLYVLINYPGYVRCFQAGPFEGETVKSGRIDVLVPKPGSLTINIAPKAGAAHQYHECGAALGVTPEIPDGHWYFDLPAVFHSGDSFQVAIDDLVPGFYTVSAFTGGKDNRQERKRADYCLIRRGIEVKSDQSAIAALALETFDEDSARHSLRGEHTAIVTIHRNDGSPAAGKPFAVSFYLDQFGRNLTVRSGQLPDDGRVVIDELPDESKGSPSIEVDGQLGEEITIEHDQPEQTFDFTLPPAVGEHAPNMTLTKLQDGAKFDLASLRGQVVMLDFWSSWCGPCQEPMAKYNEILRRRGGDWGDRAVIIGASIDNDIETIRTHVTKRGWTNVHQAFCGEGTPGFNSDAAKQYAVRGIPSAFLIDGDGVIVWTGHPATHDVEDAIDKLLNKAK